MKGKAATRPGTASKPFALFTLILIFISVPLFAAVKSRMPFSPIPEKGFAQKSVPFSLPDTQGNLQSLDRYKGKGVFLYFFTPALAGSHDDLEKINKVYVENQTRKEGFEFLGICSGCSKKQAAKIKGDKNIAFPLCVDSDWSVTRAYGISALPVSLVIASWRTIKYDYVGLIPNMKEKFLGPFDQFLGIRLGIWRFRHGTKEEKSAFVKTLTPQQRLKVFDKEDERIVRIASKTRCICDQKLNLIQCGCDKDYKEAMYRWINFFLMDGVLTEKQIAKIMQWKYEGEAKKKALAENADKEKAP